MARRRPYLSLALYFADAPGDLVMYRSGDRMVAGRFKERIKHHSEDVLVLTNRAGEGETNVRQTHVYKYPRSGQTESR